MICILKNLLVAVSLLPVLVFAAASDGAILKGSGSTPRSVKATYKVFKAGISIGTIEEQFTRDGDRYKIVSETETAGPLRLFLRDHLTVTSEGTIDAQGLKPQTYQFARRNDQKKNISAEFLWDKRQIVSHHSDEREVFELPAGTQDRVSAMYQFMFSNPRGADVSVWMSQGKKVEHYRYRKVGEPVLTVNNESIPTVYYARDAKDGESRAHLWLAKGRHYLPVKIVFVDAGGASLEQMLVALQTE